MWLLPTLWPRCSSFLAELSRDESSNILMIVTLVIPNDIYEVFNKLSPSPRLFMEEILIKYIDELEDTFQEPSDKNYL